jgi:predicted secreted protein
VTPPFSKDQAAPVPDPDVKSLSTTCGGNVRINLWEDRTRGELWVPAYDPAVLILTDDDFLRTANGNALEAGRRTFEFQAVAPGSHRVVFEKRLAWKFTAEDRRVFLIDVADGTTSPTSNLTSSTSR